MVQILSVLKKDLHSVLENVINAFFFFSMRLG